MTVVAACQLAPRTADPAGNLSAAAVAVRAAAAGGARLIVLPELCTSGYAFEATAWVATPAAAAEDLAGPTLSLWSALATELDVVIVGGFCEQGGSPQDRPYNSAAIVTARGVAAVYRKAHLWDRERDLFAAGDAPPPVVDTPVGRVGVLICYDLEFPEWSIRPALAGADVIAVPTAWPVPPVPVPGGERSLEMVRAQAAAAAGCCWVVLADHCGEDGGVAFQGDSTVIGPDGYPVMAPLGDLPGTALAECDLTRSARLRAQPRGHLIADRRPELAAASQIVDLSVVLGPDTQVFPGDPVPAMRPARTVPADGFAVLHVVMGSQTGTHVDAPCHVRTDGPSIDELPLSRFVGAGVVADLRGRPPRTAITWDDLAPAAPRLRPGAILLLMTGWDARMGTPAYFDHPFLTADATAAVLSRGVRTIGIDAPNLDETLLAESAPAALPSHHLIAAVDGVIVENLRGLYQVQPGDSVSVMPLRLSGADGAPCRAYAFR